jgi:hydrogenase nickel incorporation protein HypB
VGGLGSGKTALIRAALARLAGRRKVGVVSARPPVGRGDSAADSYADAAAVLHVATGRAPWLTAAQVREALDRLPTDELEVLLVESVGSRGRTSAAPDLGEDVTVCVLSVVAAGDGEVVDYCRYGGGLNRLVVLNKIDLLPMVSFDRSAFGRGMGGDGPASEVIETSARTGEGVGDFVDWLLARAPAPRPRR